MVVLGAVQGEEDDLVVLSDGVAVRLEHGVYSFVHGVVPFIDGKPPENGGFSFVRY
jgi:hypothetical protein